MAHKLTVDLIDSEYKTIGEGTVSIRDLAGALRQAEQADVAELLSDYCNRLAATYPVGIEIGRALQEKHRTLQGTVLNLCLGILIGIGENVRYTDPRNEVAVKTSQQIARDLEDGRFYCQPFI